MGGGEKQRVAIARAIVMEPSVMLLDEPLSALDGLTRERLRRELKRIHQVYGTTIIHVTHNFEEVFSLADKVAVMNKGEIVQVGTPEEIFQKAQMRDDRKLRRSREHLSGSRIKKSRHDGDSGGRLEDSRDGRRGRRRRNDGERSDKLNGWGGPRGLRIGPARGDPDLQGAAQIERRNSFSGRVDEIANRGMMVKVWVDVGISFMTMLTRLGYEEMDLKVGDPVYLTFKATAIHVF